ncbi:hypothetical protein KCU81_g7190, partial [Aureobasidium melanogenum]|uniref:Uncharacterized protein n=1 Tax=Aureobasidium melanogenum (strain CBS 110374) TaxID=1043003 RepID=A0A074VHY5_AURM1
MASHADNTTQDTKANKEVKNETADKTVKDEEIITSKSNDQTPVENSSQATTDTMPEDNNADETTKPKARFRKGNMFINGEQANAYFNKKK